MYNINSPQKYKIQYIFTKDFAKQHNNMKIKIELFILIKKSLLEKWHQNLMTQCIDYLFVIIV